MPTCGKARAWRGRGMIGGRARKRTREARTHEWRSSSPAEWAGLIGDAERRDQRCSIGDGAGMSEASMRASKSVMYCKSRLQLSAERRLPLSAPSHGPLAPAGHAPVRGADRAARQRHLGHPLLPSALKAENPVGPVDTRLREGAGASRAHCERRSRPGMAGEAVGGRGGLASGESRPLRALPKGSLSAVHIRDVRLVERRELEQCVAQLRKVHPRRAGLLGAHREACGPGGAEVEPRREGGEGWVRPSPAPARAAAAARAAARSPTPRRREGVARRRRRPPRAGRR